jgi:hypothetical protein
LIHKAVGWMLREVGKRDVAALETFLGEYCRAMPRTALRYAIERFPEEKRLGYMDETIRNNTGRTPKLATMVFDRGKGMIAKEED